MEDKRDTEVNDSRKSVADTDDEQSQRLLGLRCPKCGCEDFRTIDGRPWDTVKTIQLPGAIRRYKICRYCGKTVRTKETVER